MSLYSVQTFLDVLKIALESAGAEFLFDETAESVKAQMAELPNECFKG